MAWPWVRQRRAVTPTILQMEAVECGAAALAIILAHHGRHIPLTELRRECGVSRDGSKASNVVKAARRHGLVARGFSKDIDGLKALSLPVIVFWNFNHFLVIEGFDKAGNAFINDPARGHYKVDPDSFSQAFTGVVLTFEPGPDFEPRGEPYRVFPALHRMLQGHYRSLAFPALAGLLLVFPGLAMPALTQVFIDQVVVGGRGGWLQPVLIFMAAVAVLDLAMLLYQSLLVRRIGLSWMVRLNARLVDHILRLPLSFHAQRMPGEVASRSSQATGVTEVISGELLTVLVDVVTIVFYLSLMMYYHVGLSLACAVLAVLSFLMLQRISAQRREANMGLVAEQGKVQATLVAGLQNIESLKASGLEDGFYQRWAGHYAHATNAGLSLQRSSLLLGAVPGLLGSLATLMILWWGGTEVMQGNMSLGMLVAYQGLAGGFFGPVRSLVELGSTLQTTYGDLLRLDDVLRHPAPEETAPDPRKTIFGGTRLAGHVQLKQVTFGYNPLVAPTIEGLDLEVRPGHRVAFVGASGSGKSTVARLLAGLYEPWSGEILFDGLPRRKIPPRVLQHCMGFVDQDLCLFEGSIFENLSMWDATMPRNMLVRASEDACIDEVVRQLPGEYDAELLEGGDNLSGGQRQRLEIARALANAPSLLIMDEATSALDTETERLVDDNIRRRGCTCIIVAHRLSTIRDSDEILVFEEGRVVERGTHEELWKMAGVYYSLLRSEESDVEEVA